MIKPKKLNKGDKVAIVSLSSGILGEKFTSHQLNLGIERLKSFGLIPVFMPNSLKGLEHIKNNPQDRAQDLKDAFFNDEIKGIICVIGGDDTFRTLPYLMEDKSFIEKVKSNPKVFTGYSDTTINHLMFYKLGMVSYYGPNFLVDLAELDSEMLPYTKESFMRFFVNEQQNEIKSSSLWYEERSDFSNLVLGTSRISHAEKRGFEFFRGKNSVEGILLGGCLESLYDAIVSERYKEEKEIIERYSLFPSDWKNKILFLETSEEKHNPKHYREMLNELKKKDIFKNVSAVIVGKPQDEVYYNEYKDIILDITSEYMVPIVFNLNFGHAHPKTIIPYGIKMKIDFKDKKIFINETMFEK
ncbi:S66 family peptidase [Haploplasma axanthum]|uniref:L,D-carboxypeptidase A n=1 Tax=Haploplasma axanthum TaxID=29552 RepID=A0A449BFM6_HAPAX|nr:S66 peptidase family protein [Haploplasma axanthum]VEU81252.1 L,D-carboxypeptidase A [Haploplasma axanthum]